MTYPSIPSIVPSAHPPTVSTYVSSTDSTQYRASAPITIIDRWSLDDIVQHRHTPATTPSPPPFILQWNACIDSSLTSLTRRSLYHHLSFMGNGIEVMVGVSNDLLATLSYSMIVVDLWVSQNVYRYMI
ncbi:unnamed protein product [Lactuca saligna]|uniref:Uncharacterized protein n=1 Tax=Lactuca saligna TaxID=75948 RepID=A0AA35UW50_LACSI|nr:unnamed protein product [Lactuca saligna]